MATVDGRVKGHMIVVRGLHRATLVHYGLAISFSKWSTRALALACYGTSRTAVLYWSKPVGPYFRAIRIKSRVWILDPFRLEVQPTTS